MSHRSLIAAASVTLVVAMLASSAPARAAERIRGLVTDGVTGQPLSDVCVTLGSPSTCFTRTDAVGRYRIDLDAAPPASTWEMYFLREGTHQTAYSGAFAVQGAITFNQVLMPVGQRELCPAQMAGTPTQIVYLANVTKTYGGPIGWQTPFILQNTGTSPTTLEVSFHRFLNGACALRRTVMDLMPGTSFADVPNKDNDLPGDTQFSVVVRSFGSTAVAVVNEHVWGGDGAEAMAYNGVSRGTTSVFLPNITRRFNGYVTPFIIQNLGVADATASARFVSFSTGARRTSRSRGRSRRAHPSSWTRTPSRAWSTASSTRSR